MLGPMLAGKVVVKLLFGDVVVKKDFVLWLFYSSFLSSLMVMTFVAYLFYHDVFLVVFHTYLNAPLILFDYYYFFLFIYLT